MQIVTNYIHKVLWVTCSAVFILLLSGCGAPAGTGLNTVVTASSLKTITIEEVLAVDDRLVGSSIHIGTSLNADGSVNPLALQEILTSSDGKTSRLVFTVPDTSQTLYLQASGGKSGNENLSSSSRFLGVLDLVGISNAPRVNITPYSTLVAYARSLQPSTPVSQLAAEAIQPFLNTTQSASIDLNSVAYLGNRSDVVETAGNAPLFQIYNEMIKLAARNQTATNLVDKTASLLASARTQLSTASFFSSTSATFFTAVSQISQTLATSPQAFGPLFSQAFQILATSPSAGVRITTWVTAATTVENAFVVQPQVLLDSLPFDLSVPTTGLSIITTSASGGISLSTIPAKVTFTRTSDNLAYQPILSSQMRVTLEVYAIGQESIADTIRVTVNPVNIQASPTFTMVFPQGAILQGARSNEGGSAQATVVNQSADTYPSTTQTIEFPISEFLAKAQTASGGQALPSFSGRTINLEIRFQDNVRIRRQQDSTYFHGFRIDRARIQ